MPASRTTSRRGSNFIRVDVNGDHAAPGSHRQHHNQLTRWQQEDVPSSVQLRVADDTERHTRVATAALGDWAPDVINHPSWPTLAATIDRSQAAGLDPRRVLVANLQRCDPEAGVDALALELDRRVNRYVDAREQMAGRTPRLTTSFVAAALQAAERAR